MLNSIDLFSGCGGMTLGFGWAGFNSVLASDIDENCKKRNPSESLYVIKKFPYERVYFFFNSRLQLK